MILAVFSEELSPLNAASSVLLNRLSRFLVSAVHPQITLHTLSWYWMDLLRMIFSLLTFLVLPMIFSVPSSKALMRLDQQLGSHLPT